MKRAVARWIATAAALALGVNCSHSSSPTAPSVGIPGTPGTGATPAPASLVTVPLSPASETHVDVAAQPITLVIKNATAGGDPLIVDEFEVATDLGFASKVDSRNVAQAAGPQTTTVLNRLAPGRYYWHVRAAAGESRGNFSSAFTFVVDAASVPSILLPPTPMEPLPGSVQSQRPTFLITNPVYPASVARVTYRFELSRDASFAQVMQRVDKPDFPAGSGSSGGFTRLDLGWDAGQDLPSGVIYWRVQSIDAATGAASAYSTVQQFTVGAPFVEPPTLVSPAAGSTVPSYQPTLVAATGHHSGRPFDLIVQFQLSKSPTFSPLISLGGGILTDAPQASDIIRNGLDAGVYYWRAQSILIYRDIGSGLSTNIASDFTPAWSFVVGPVVLQPPTLALPTSNAVTHPRPALVVNDVARSGPAGNLLYAFEVDANGVPLASATVPETPGQTSWTVPYDLATNVTYSWKVQALDPASGAVSGYTSSVFTVFSSQAAFYTLEIDWAPGCVSRGVTAFTFTGASADSPNGPTFTLTTLGSLSISLTNAVGALSGTIGGVAGFRTSGPITVKVAAANGGSDPATLVGAATGGRLTGTLNGFVSADDSFDFHQSCAASNIGWSVTPQ
jgi:hypothetical protein